MAHEIIAALSKELGHDCHPLLGLLKIANDVSQPMELRAACNRDALPYVLPKLQNQTLALTGPNGDGPVELATIDLTELLADSKATEVLLQAAMLMAEHGAPSSEVDRRGVFSPSAQPKLLEAGEESEEQSV